MKLDLNAFFQVIIIYSTHFFTFKYLGRYVSKNWLIRINLKQDILHIKSSYFFHATFQLYKLK